MSKVSNQESRKGVLDRCWSALKRPSTRYGAGILLIIGFIIGGVSWQGFNSVVAYTNTVNFCTSCHAMEAFVYPDYKKSVHFSNASGVQATCANCHVPQAFVPKMATKIKATLVEVPSHLMGRIATEEKFEANKLALAERVWDRMKANDSRECRSCHSWDNMSEQAQLTRARVQHASARASGGTCIDCHRGVAHALPAAYLQTQELEQLEEEDDIDFDF